MPELHRFEIKEAVAMSSPVVLITGATPLAGRKPVPRPQAKPVEAALAVPPHWRLQTKVHASLFPAAGKKKARNFLLNSAGWAQKASSCAPTFAMKKMCGI